MQKNTEQFDTDHLAIESTDFVEYQHKKLEKVAEIIEEEERAAKLLAESAKPPKQQTKTKVVIDSIVKHDKSKSQDDSNEVSEQIDEETLSLTPATSEAEAIPVDEMMDDDQVMFDEIDLIAQTSENDLTLEPMIDSNENESAVTLTLDASEATAIVEQPQIEEPVADDSAFEIEISEALPLEVESETMPDETHHTVLEIDESSTGTLESEPDAEIPTLTAIEETPETIVENEDDAIVDFVAAEDATAVEQSTTNQSVEVAQPKISKIGRLLLDLGKISRSDTKKILRAQKKHGLLFGDAALKLGLIEDDDIQKVVAMQFNYHYLQAGQGKFSDDLVAAYVPFSKKVENYRALRSQLMMRWFKKGQRALAIVGANSGDGVSYLTANLGVVFSQLGARTLIIEANMRSPRQQTLFNIQRPIGLSDMIVGKNGSEAIQEIESIPDLSVLHAGTVPPNPQELLGRTSFNLLFKTLSDSYDVILIDTPPVVQSADAQSVIELAQGAMLVSRLHHTRHEDVIQMRHLIEMTDANIVSAVMNEF